MSINLCSEFLQQLDGACFELPHYKKIKFYSFYITNQSIRNQYQVRQKVKKLSTGFPCRTKLPDLDISVV